MARDALLLSVAPYRRASDCRTAVPAPVLAKAVWSPLGIRPTGSVRFAAVTAFGLQGEQVIRRQPLVILPADRAGPGEGLFERGAGLLPQSLSRYVAGPSALIGASYFSSWRLRRRLHCSIYSAAMAAVAGVLTKCR